MGICFNKSKIDMKSNNEPITLNKNSTPQSEDPTAQQQAPARRNNRKRLSLWKVDDEDEKETHEQIQIFSTAAGHNFQRSSTKNFEKPEQGSLMLVTNRVMLGGAAAVRRQHGFEDKKTQLEGDNVDPDVFKRLGIAFACKKGLKPESPNQDDFSVVVDENLLLLGVFDGHGPYGHDVSNFVHTMLPKLIVTNEEMRSNTSEVMRRAFLKANDALFMHCDHPESNFDCFISGTTASVALIRDRRLYMAHVGDSRVVMARQETNKLTAIRVTQDHKPNSPGERERIVQSNGEVKKLPGDIPYRVFVKDKEFPGLAMSRAIGDKLAQNIGVICDPEVNEVELHENDLYLILCSDGVWEFMSDQDVVDILSKHQSVKGAADSIASEAWTRWLDNEEDIVDDITVIIADLTIAK